MNAANGTLTMLARSIDVRRFALTVKGREKGRRYGRHKDSKAAEIKLVISELYGMTKDVPGNRAANMRRRGMNVIKYLNKKERYGKRDNGKERCRT